MKYSLLLLVGLLTTLTIGCSDNHNAAQKQDSGLFKTQTQALQRAKGVQQTVLNAAKRQDQQINNETR